MALNENAKKLVAALRSDDFEQGIGRLKDGKGRLCCLGVACELYRREHLADGAAWFRGSSGPDFIPAYYSLTRDTVLPTQVRDWLGLASTQGMYDIRHGESTSLTFANDHGKSFAEIADIIESEPEGLFKP